MNLRVESRPGLIDLLRQLLANPDSELPVLNLVGPYGMGKSYLLRQVFEQVASDYPVAALNFAAPAGTWATGAAPLRALLPPDGPTPEHPELAPLAVSVSCALQAPRQPGQPWLLLIDGVDALEQWPVLQRALIKPVVERTRALVIVASRSPVAWHFWELRARCRPLSIPRLVPDETLAMARQAARTPLGLPLHDLALGHPAAVETLLRHFRVDPPPEGPEPRLDTLSKATRAVVGVVGVMRAVHVPTMERLLRRFLPGWSTLGDSSSRHLQEALRELKTRGHLDYSRGHRTVFTLALRRAVEADLQRRSPQRLLALWRELEAIYYDQALGQPITEARAVNEWLYFSAAPLRTSGDREPWARRWRQLCERAALGGADLPAQVYRDEDLLARLQEAGCLEAVHAALQEYVPIDAAVFTRDEARYGAYAAELLGRMLSPATHQERARLLALLDAARAMPDSFQAAELASVLAARTGDSITGIRRDLAVLVDRGCCSYDPATRAYALHPLIRRLLRDTPPRSE